MNHTPNYQLSQWEATDKVQRADFNADNAKIDAALKAETDARVSAVSVLTSRVTKCGNCKIWTTTYTGNNTYGSDNPTTFTFPGKPLLVVISCLQSKHCLVLVQGVSDSLAITNSNAGNCFAIWNGNSVSLIGSNQSSEQMNYKSPYRVVALIAADE